MQNSLLNRATRLIRPVVFAAYEHVNLTLTCENETTIPATLALAVYDVKTGSLLASNQTPVISQSTVAFALDFANENVADLFRGQGVGTCRDVNIVVYDQVARDEWAQGRALLRQDLALESETLPPVDPVKDWVYQVNGKSGDVHLTAADIPYSDAPETPNVDEYLLQNANAIAAHVARIDNPHGVTKDQVGLGNVDNTSDLDKPVSTATQTALNGKLDTTSGDVAIALDGTAIGLDVADTAGAFHTKITTQGIINNYPYGTDNTLAFPDESGTLATTDDIPSAGIITSGSTGYATGGAVYNALADKLDTTGGTITGPLTISDEVAGLSAQYGDGGIVVNGNSLTFPSSSGTLALTPQYTTAKHAYLSSLSSSSDIYNFHAAGLHRWTMPHNGVLYIFSRSGNTSNLPKFQIGINLDSSATSIDNDHTIMPMLNPGFRQTFVYTLLLNAGDETAIDVSYAATEIVFSAFYV